MTDRAHVRDGHSVRERDVTVEDSAPMKAPQALPLDETTAALRALAARWQERLAGRASVSPPHDEGGVEGFSVSSPSNGTVEVWVVHDADGVVVSLGGAPGWELPRESASVAVVEAIVAAAVEGRIEVGTGRGLRSYRAPMPDGSVREDAAEGLAALLLAMPWKPRLRWATAAPYP